MPKAIKGDHTILGAPPPSASYADAASRARSKADASAATKADAKARKTPSPQPPSPNPSSWASGTRAKGPISPSPPPMSSSRPAGGFSVSDSPRRSPKGNERSSPTGPKSACSPTETVPVPRPPPKGHARSLSTSTTPTPPTTHSITNNRFAALTPRSKSQASEAIGSSSRVGSEARRPTRRDLSVETRDAFTQTEGDDLGEPFGDFDQIMCDVDMESVQGMTRSELVSGLGSGCGEEEHAGAHGEGREGSSPSAVGDSGFLSASIRMQAELEMVLRSQMEMIAEGPSITPPATTAEANTGPRASPQAKFGQTTVRAQRPVPMPPQTLRPVHARSSGRTHGPLARMGRSSREGKGGEDAKDADGSDGECAHEDDEVKSLSLSEDGPVIRRSLSEGAGNLFRGPGAPDPIAMLSDGTRKAMLSARSVIANAAGEAAATLSAATDSMMGARWSGESEIVDTLTDGVGALDVSDAAAAIVPTLFTSALADDDAFVNSADGEPLGSMSDRSMGDRSMPNESDNSAAPTHYAQGEAGAPASDSALYKNLIPILSKVTGAAGDAPSANKEGAADPDRATTPIGSAREPKSPEQPTIGQLEVVQEAPGVSASDARRRGWVPTKSLRVPAKRSSSSSVQALDLSQLAILPPLSAAAKADGGAVAAANQDARSDVSFGSAQSAFTSWSNSSPSSSQLASPRPHMMKHTVSMPALHSSAKALGSAPKRTPQ